MSGDARETPSRGSILIVDDEPGALRLADRFLSRLGYDVRTATSPAEALRRLEERPEGLVITDLHMPDGSGLQLLATIRSRWTGLRTILMSGGAAASDAAVAIEHGVDRLLLKPFSLDELKASVEKAFAEQAAQAEIARERKIFEAALRQRNTQSQVWVLRAAHALAAAVEAKDAYTAGHAARVTAYALAIGEEIGGIDRTRFRLAGDLHDVGKIGVPDAVLNRPGRLSPAEFEEIRRHPAAGEKILRSIIDDPLVLDVVRSHHERWDGTGYPDGLEGERIPLLARILALADTLDAMTSNRSYRSGLPWETAIAEIQSCSGSQFDPAVVLAFTHSLERLRSLYDSFQEAERQAALHGPETS